jgi:AcrR family transcriptional regulator
MTKRSPAPSSAPLSVKLAQNGILAAAVGVFAKKGALATRVEDLLEAADVARRTFYRYFGSKEDVLAALYDLATGELVRAIQLLSSDDDPLGGLHRVLDLYLDFHVGNGALIKVLVEEAIRSESPLAPMRRRFRDQMAGELARAAERATGEEQDPITFTALLAALEGTSLYLLEGHGAPSPQLVARAKRAMHRMLDRVAGVPERPRRSRAD